MSTTPRVLMHCNAGSHYGMGHLMRTVALAEEALGRGWEVDVVGDIDDAAAARFGEFVEGARVQQTALGELQPVFDDAIRAGVDVVHLDSYWAIPSLPRAGVLVSNMQDGEYGARAADVCVDANLGAERRSAHSVLCNQPLLGADFTLIRRQVKRWRHESRDRASARAVLVVIGGTDPFDVTPRVCSALASSAGGMHVTVVAPRRQHQRILDTVAGAPTSFEIMEFLADLPAAAFKQDLVISAAGTSVWDFACMGVPMAIVEVTENQRAGYDAAVAAEIAHPLGRPGHAAFDENLRGVEGLLSDHELLINRVKNGQRLIDGNGGSRVVTAWESLLAELAERKP